MTNLIPTSTRTVAQYIEGVKHVKPTSATLTKHVSLDGTTAHVVIVLHHAGLVDVTLVDTHCYWGSVDAAECTVSYIAETLGVSIPVTVVKPATNKQITKTAIFVGQRLKGTLTAYLNMGTFSFDDGITIVMGSLSQLSNVSLHSTRAKLTYNDYKVLLGA